MKKRDEIPTTNPFKVPENYFDEVNRKIISATVGDYTEVKRTGLYRRLRPHLAVAASVAGLVILSYTAIKLFTPDRKSMTLSKIDIEEYSEALINDIDLLTLEQNAAPLVLFEERPEVDKKDIIDYLLLENIDINDIYEQL